MLESMSDNDLRLKVGTRILFKVRRKWDIIAKMSRSELEQKFDELFPKCQEPPDYEASRRDHGPKSLASHPRGSFWTLLIQCKQCLLIESIDARRNGMPGGLQLEIGGKVLTETSMAKKIKKLTCKGCGGTFRIIGKMPNGYNKLYLPKPELRNLLKDSPTRPKKTNGKYQHHT